VRVTPGARGAPATALDFVPEGADAFDAVVGLKADAVTNGSLSADGLQEIVVLRLPL
jgi:hypothetical protein